MKVVRVNTFEPLEKGVLDIIRSWLNRFGDWLYRVFTQPVASKVAEQFLADFAENTQIQDVLASLLPNKVVTTLLDQINEPLVKITEKIESFVREVRKEILGEIKEREVKEEVGEGPSGAEETPPEEGKLVPVPSKKLLRKQSEGAAEREIKLELPSTEVLFSVLVYYGKSGEYYEEKKTFDISKSQRVVEQVKNINNSVNKLLKEIKMAEGKVKEERIKQLAHTLYSHIETLYEEIGVSINEVYTNVIEGLKEKLRAEFTKDVKDLRLKLRPQINAILDELKRQGVVLLSRGEQFADKVMRGLEGGMDVAIVEAHIDRLLNTNLEDIKGKVENLVGVFASSVLGEIEKSFQITGIPSPKKKKITLPKGEGEEEGEVTGKIDWRELGKKFGEKVAEVIKGWTDEDKGNLRSILEQVVVENRGSPEAIYNFLSQSNRVNIIRLRVELQKFLKEEGIEDIEDGREFWEGVYNVLKDHLPEERRRMVKEVRIPKRPKPIKKLPDLPKVVTQILLWWKNLPERSRRAISGILHMYLTETDPKVRKELEKELVETAKRLGIPVKLLEALETLKEED